MWMALNSKKLAMSGRPKVACYSREKGLEQTFPWNWKKDDKKEFICYEHKEQRYKTRMTKAQ